DQPTAPSRQPPPAGRRRTTPADLSLPCASVTVTVCRRAQVVRCMFGGTTVQGNNSAGWCVDVIEEESICICSVK
uniref:Uncharacterized protein n=1 Tax=Triticum urartu TaxID=4572 RepID=A0A8R7PFD6_TRIUA